MTTVWLHGAGLSAASWDARRAAGLRLDLPGHGGRPRAAAPTVEALAEALLPDLPPRFDLVGHSLGGMVALVLAAALPGRVERLVLVDTWPGTGSRLLPWLGARLAPVLARRVGPVRLGRMLGLIQRGASRRFIREALAAADPAGLDDALRAATAFDGRALLPRVAALTLILRGARNLLSWRPARAMAAAIPQARLAALPAGHLVPTDCPGRFYDCVDAFLRRTP
jgi:pimeloyl-ACP methyl ester carboxylesterase